MGVDASALGEAEASADPKAAIIQLILLEQALLASVVRQELLRRLEQVPHPEFVHPAVVHHVELDCMPFSAILNQVVPQHLALI